MTDRGRTEHLMVFTRYPEAGKAKTRLIPALGAEGAATIHRQMAEHTLAQARRVQSPTRSLSVHFPTGDVTQMQAWLGADLDYCLQVTGDLGDRMAHAFQSAFAADHQAVVIIGTDCPDVTVPLLEKAFQALQQHDLVLGPAVDGGYYLLGLRRVVPELFQGIPWSTADVLTHTVAIAQRLQLAIAYLPTLADVDYPNDLAIWERVNAQQASAAAQVPSSHLDNTAPSITVIIPVRNEATHIAATLKQVQTAPVEIVLVDGGSQDNTIAVADACGVAAIAAAPGRANQMNAGAQLARGDILLFLHADTRLPDGFDRLVRQTLAQPNVVAGAFRLRIQGTGWGLRLVEWGVNWRSRLLQLPYGDQAIFLKATTFQTLGGFPELPLMEDFELVCRLRRWGRVAIAPAAVLTSGRRWQKLGVLKTTLINQVAIVAYGLGVAPAHIAAWYHRWRE